MERQWQNETAHLRARVEVAAGRAPADLILANARIVNVHAGEIEEGNVAIIDGRIAGVGHTHGASETVDSAGDTSLRADGRAYSSRIESALGD